MTIEELVKEILDKIEDLNKQLEEPIETNENKPLPF